MYFVVLSNNDAPSMATLTWCIIIIILYYFYTILYYTTIFRKWKISLPAADDGGVAAQVLFRNTKHTHNNIIIIFSVY